MELNITNLNNTKDTLIKIIDTIKEDSNIKRSTFKGNKFDMEMALWDAVHVIDDLKDYWHITGKIDKFDK